jgi:hypothetical protein
MKTSLVSCHHEQGTNGNYRHKFTERENRMKTSLLLASGILLALTAALPAKASSVSYNITTTWYEPECEINSTFIGSLTYDAITHAVTGLTGKLSESMVGDSDDTTTWISLTNQLANGSDSSHIYSWYDATLHGTFATVFKNNDYHTFATSITISGKTYTGDGWSPAGGIAVKFKYSGYGTSVTYYNDVQNASALIFVPDDLSAGNTADNPLTLTYTGTVNATTGKISDTGLASGYSETGGTTNLGGLGLAYSAYADYNDGANMGSIGMTATSKYAYGRDGDMSGFPLSEVITTAAVPEPATLGLLAIGAALFLPKRKSQTA